MLLRYSTLLAVILHVGKINFIACSNSRSYNVFGGDSVVHQLLTPAEVAEILQVDEQTVRRYLREGKLRGLRIGNRWRVDQADLEAFIQANKGPEN